MEEDLKLRATGRTTRLVDFYIQELFNNKNTEIKIKDHTDDRRSNNYLMYKVLNRLENEHKVVKVTFNGINNSIILH